MKANINTTLTGRNILLVPYRPEHVPKYHEWMLSEELRRLTASDPLTLEQEYEMQQKWQFDDDKLTFIILARDDTSLALPTSNITQDDSCREILPMVGDVNIFLHGPLASDDLDAEVEIMIAEPSFRRKGLAIEALQLMLGYATGRPELFHTASSPLPDSPPDSPLNIPVQRLVARIGTENTPSIHLFQKLGFQITKHVDIFDQVEMRYCRAEQVDL